MTTARRAKAAKVEKKKGMLLPLTHSAGTFIHEHLLTSTPNVCAARAPEPPKGLKIDPDDFESIKTTVCLEAVSVICQRKARETDSVNA